MRELAEQAEELMVKRVQELRDEFDVFCLFVWFGLFSFLVVV